jgi:DNA-binding MarR family transcriptional regulator
VRTLDRLDKKWIKRLRSGLYRCVINLTFTPKAKEIIDQLMPNICEFLNNALNGITPDEFSTVKKVLGIIANNHLLILEAMQVVKV